jgi:hypothetical protein
MATTPTTVRFWLDPQTDQCHRAATHQHWLVENAPLLGLQAALSDLDPDHDADAINRIGVRSGLIRISHNGTNLSVQYDAAPAMVESLAHAVRDFLRTEELPPLKSIRIRNSHNGNERTLRISQFEEIVDYGGLVFPRFSTSALRLASLIVCHVALGCVLGLCQQPPERNATGVMFIALLYSEATLLGVWVSLANRFEWFRPVGIIAAIVYLFALLSLVVRSIEFGLFSAIIAGTFALAIFVMIVLRFTRLRLCRLAPGDSNPKSTAIQYSIRQLMIVTAAIAILFAIARSLSETREGSIINIFAPCLAAAPLLATWAMLTVGRLWLRIPVVFATSLISGLLPLFLTPDAAPDYWFWPSITFTQAIFSLATLFVVRSWGYRLVRTTLRET